MPANITQNTDNLTRKQAKHLLRRATYNVTKDRIDALVGLTPAQALTDVLLQQKTYTHDRPLFPRTDKVDGDIVSQSVVDWVYNGPAEGGGDTGSGTRARRTNLQAWWAKEAFSDTTLTSKMVYFLFTDFVAQKDSTEGDYFFDYLNLLEHYHKGDWKELCYQITISNTMLKMLNARDNKRDNPNEDFAREFLELFSIGKGPQDGIGSYTNYTEHDVQQTARVMTGLVDLKNVSNRTDEINNFRGSTGYIIEETHPMQGVLDSRQIIPTGTVSVNDHDYGEKVFSDKFGYTIPAWDDSGKTSDQKRDRIIQELREFVDMVLGQDETAKFICRKLYRFFVHKNISADIEDNIIEPLAATFRVNYNLEAVITQLFTSQHFYDLDTSDNKGNIYGGLMKTPLDLVAQTLTLTGILDYVNSQYPFSGDDSTFSNAENVMKLLFEDQIINDILVNSAQELFQPTDVSGFPADWEEQYDKLWFDSSSLISRLRVPKTLITPSRGLYQNVWFVDSILDNYFTDQAGTTPGNSTELDAALKIVLELFIQEDVGEVKPTRFAYWKGQLIDPSDPMNETNFINELMAGTQDNLTDDIKAWLMTLLSSQEFQLN